MRRQLKMPSRAIAAAGYSMVGRCARGARHCPRAHKNLYDFRFHRQYGPMTAMNLAPRVRAGRPRCSSCRPSLSAPKPKPRLMATIAAGFRSRGRRCCAQDGALPADRMPSRRYVGRTWRHFMACFPDGSLLSRGFRSWALHNRRHAADVVTACSGALGAQCAAGLSPPDSVRQDFAASAISRRPPTSKKRGRKMAFPCLLSNGVADSKSSRPSRPMPAERSPPCLPHH